MSTSTLLMMVVLVLAVVGMLLLSALGRAVAALTATAMVAFSGLASVLGSILLSLVVLVGGGATVATMDVAPDGTHAPSSTTSPVAPPAGDPRRAETPREGGRAPILQPVDPANPGVG